MENLIIQSSLNEGSIAHNILALNIKKELGGRKFDNMMVGVMTQISKEYAQTTVELREAKREIEELKAQNKTQSNLIKIGLIAIVVIAAIRYIF